MTETLYRIDDVGKFPGDLIFIRHGRHVFYKIADGSDFGTVVSVFDTGRLATVPTGWTVAQLQHPVDTRPDRVRKWDRLRRKHLADYPRTETT